MGTTTLLGCCSFSYRCNQKIIGSDGHKNGISRTRACCPDEKIYEGVLILKRRTALVSGLSTLVSSALLLGFSGQAGLAAVKQGLLAGRVPGLSEPDEQGWRTYRRPDEKSGGHGVGWSPIIPYSFSVPPQWEEVPVSIADLGGTEIDLRFANSKQGRCFVIVAPVLRFADNLGDDAKLELIGPPEKVISAFGPEVIGENVEGKVLSMDVAQHSGRTYYQFELEPPHVIITATAAGNRLYLFSVTANGLQWKRNYKDLKKIADSFRVV
uniref:Photosystem II reaction center PsbP family protein n=1 Tax=Pelargonium hortorum TaxID=4031 RepID=A0A0F7GYT7_PELHO